MYFDTSLETSRIDYSGLLGPGAGGLRESRPSLLVDRSRRPCLRRRRSGRLRSEAPVLLRIVPRKRRPELLGVGLRNLNGEEPLGLSGREIFFLLPKYFFLQEERRRRQEERR
jgi:hypothetical protein